MTIDSTLPPAGGPRPFDLTGRLPDRGTHILEASAGTGKTYAIAALVARYLAEGVPLSDLLVLTFSRLATQELRHRIRGRLTATETALQRSLTGDVADPDRIEQLLCRGSVAERELRLHRITAALADFDAAMITTFHEGCGRLLDGLGVLGGLDPAATHIEDVTDLAREVAADFWLRAFADAERPDFSWAEAQAIAERVAGFDGPLAPDPAVLPGFARQISFARAVRLEVGRRKSLRGLYTYEDLLTRLRDLLDGRIVPDGETDDRLADAVRTQLRERFPVVLVDEFQDTDPIQWQILDKAFRGHSTLIVIGDPKQAIYGFRGADVQAYLAAVASPGAQQHTLDENWRSDAGLVDALHSVFGGAQLGDPRITVRPVRAHHRQDRLCVEEEDLRTPFRLRVIPPAVPQPSRTSGPSLTQLRDTIRRDLVEDIIRLLGSGARLQVGSPGRVRGVTPRDIAVLVNTNHAAERIRAACTSADIPAVHAGATSVFGTPAAQDWLTLLRACETPRSQTIRELALTSFVGWTFVELVTASEQQLADLSGRIRSWARTLRLHGVSGLVEAVLGAGLAERLLRESGGDRTLTDLRHLGELVHAAQTRGRLGTTALVAWLREQITTKAASGERTRRMESDADAVQVMTLHQAKGLEFPIVYLPDQWELAPRRDISQAPFTFHHDGVRHLYLAPSGRDRARARALHDAEEAGEALRKLYVAATRAQCRVVAWWASHQSHTCASPLHRLLFRAGSPEPKSTYPVDISPADLLQAPGVLVQQVGAVLVAAANPLVESLPELTPRTFDRVIDEGWRRTSYSALTAHAHDLAVPQTGGLPPTAPPAERDDDEIHRAPDEPPAAVAIAEPLARGESAEPPPGPLGAVSPMADLPRGPAFGTLVHAIYENFDPQAEDLAADVRQHAARWLPRLPMTSETAESSTLSSESLTEALLPAIRTPLGPVADDLRLCDVPASDRLAELAFEYALGGGDTPTSRSLVLRHIADLLKRHLPGTDLLHAYPDRLADPVLAEETLRGYLVGSIDAVLRVPARPRSEPAGSTPGRDLDQRLRDSTREQRYVIVDYKTNWLGPLDGADALRVGHYTPAAMAEAMMAAHYPLQAVLYAVAVHRFLRWRLPGYDPERHLGGIAYLFVRGMAGPDTPVVGGMPCGVFTWRPPTALIIDLSDLLAGHEETG